MLKKTKFAVIGGDMRQKKLAEFLREDGYEAAAFALGGPDELSFAETVKGAGVVVLPLPAEQTGGLISTPMSEERVETKKLLEILTPGQLVCAGKAGACLREMAEERGIELVDYLRREELAVLNAAATAEGAIQIMMEELPTTIWRSKVLVVGFGRIGKALAHRLMGLGAETAVSARKFSDAAWIKIMGCEALDTGKLEKELHRFDCVVNTVPARVLGRERLERLNKACLCLDLASKPGGMDFEAASELGLRAIWALSLPGKTAPVSSGEMIRDTIYNILEERGMGL